MSKLDKASPATPTQEGELLKVTSSVSWLALLGFLLLVLSGTAWAFLARLPVDVSGNGVIVPQGGFNRARTPTAGLVASLEVSVGDQVRAGQLIGSLRSSHEAQDEGDIQVTSPDAGTILEVLVEKGSFVEQGGALVTIGMGDPKLLSAWLFVPYDNAVAIEEHMDAFLTLDAVAAEQHGYLRGRVLEIGTFPATEASLVNSFGHDPQWVAYLLGSDVPQALVKIGLERSTTPSGYAWTIGDGPERILESGMRLKGDVRVSYSRPIDSALAKPRKRVKDASSGGSH